MIFHFMITKLSIYQFTYVPTYLRTCLHIYLCAYVPTYLCTYIIYVQAKRGFATDDVS